MKPCTVDGASSSILLEVAKEHPIQQVGPLSNLHGESFFQQLPQEKEGESVWLPLELTLITFVTASHPIRDAS